MLSQNILLGIILALGYISGISSFQKQDRYISEKKFKEPKAIEVTAFEELQVTGLSISNDGRLFACFPRWRFGIPFSVVEVNINDGKYKPYPDIKMNTWEIGDNINDSSFVAIQSVYIIDETLYILDTRNPIFNGVLDAPKIFVYDLHHNKLLNIYTVEKKSIRTNSYVNDLRVDKNEEKIYITDSGEAGIIILDMKSGKSKRILDNHYSTLAEADHLIIDGIKWNNTVHSDGIALDTINKKLYYHSLTGYNLYAIETEYLNGNDSIIENKVQWISKTSAPDGMIFDKNGNLYFSDLEKHRINYLTPDNHIQVLLEGEMVKWADSFSIYEGYLFYTNSRIHETTDSIEGMDFTINKVKLPKR